MIAKIVRYLYRLTRREKIAALPNTFATKFNDYSRAEALVMARLGVRSPSGVKRAMRRAGVETIEELTTMLDHLDRRPPVGKRWGELVARAVGGTPYDPHARAIESAVRPRRAKDTAIKQRVKALSKAVNEEMK